MDDTWKGVGPGISSRPKTNSGQSHIPKTRPRKVVVRKCSCGGDADPSGVRASNRLAKPRHTAGSGKGLRGANLSALAGRPGKIITLQFDSSGARPRLVSSNIRDLLRGIPNLLILDTVLREISLDRLAQQLEQQTDSWIGDRLYVLQQMGGHGVKLERLDRVTVQILSAPTFTYDATRQTISFHGKAKVFLSGRIQVNIALNAGDVVGGWFGSDPNHEFDISVVVNDYDLPGQLQFSNPYVDAARVRLLLSPHPGQIAVSARLTM